MESLKPYSYLKEIEFRCRLSHIGGTYYNIKDPSNPLMECFFFPHSDAHNNLNDMFDYSQTRADNYYLSIGITVGYLPCLCAGDVYLRGEKTKASKFNHSDVGSILEFDVDLDHPPKETTLGDAINGAFFNKDLDRLKLSPVKELDGYLNSLVSISQYRDINGIRKIENGNDVKLIIPETELLRFYYAKSNKLALAIFNNFFTNDNIPKFITNEIHEKPKLQDGKFRFVYRHGFNEADAIVLGRILASDIAKQAVRRVFQTKTIDEVNLKPDFFFRTDFPFRGKSTLRVKGRLGVIKNNDVFIVQQILSCSGEFPFSELSYCDEIKTGNPNPHGKSMGMKPSPPRVTDEKKPNEERGESTSTDGPNKDLKPLTLKIASSSFSALNDIARKSEKLKDSTHVSDKRPPHPAHTGEDVSSGQPKNNGNGKSPQKMVDESFATIPSDNLKNITQAVRNPILSAHCKSIESLTLSDGLLVDYLGETLVPFPRTMCPVQDKKRKFSYVDDNYTTRRRVICFQIEYKKNNSINYFYILEAEERNTTAKLSTLFLHRKNMEIIDEHTLQDVLSLTVEKQEWPRYENHPELKTETIVITENTNSAAVRLLSKIENIFQQQTTQD